MKIHLGCSDDLKPGFLNVDQHAPPGVELAAGARLGAGMTRGGPAAFCECDLNNPWPWETSTVDSILAHDVFEHLHGFGHGNLGKIHCMNEAWRVLKPGGILDFSVPSLLNLDGSVNAGAVADPTHCTWWTWDDQFYFSEQFNSDRVFGTFNKAMEAGERFRLGPAYGIKARFHFPLVLQSEDGTWKDRSNQRGFHRWFVRNDAGGKRAKLIGLLEAIK